MSVCHVELLNHSALSVVTFLICPSFPKPSCVPCWIGSGTKSNKLLTSRGKLDLRGGGLNLGLIPKKQRAFVKDRVNR